MENGLSATTAAVLAGGLGTRLQARVKDMPKVLAPVAGKPFLFHLLDQISGFGVRHVVLCTGYRARQIHDTLQSYDGGVEVECSEEETLLGTGGALRRALPLYRSDPVLVMNGDSFCRADLDAFLDWHFERDATAALLLTEVADTSRFGRVQTSEEGNVLSFDEKGAQGRGWINAGVYLFRRSFLASIPDSGFVSLERDVLPRWVGKGLKGYRTTGAFIDIGMEEDYSRADQFFRDIGKGRAK